MNTERVPAHRSESRQPASGYRGPWYERPSEADALAEQFFDSRVSRVKVCPETALMYAVLEDAFRCFIRSLRRSDGLSSARGRLRNGFSAMIRTGSSPSCLSVMRSSWNQSTYGRSLGTGPHPAWTHCGQRGSASLECQPVSACNRCRNNRGNRKEPGS